MGIFNSRKSKIFCVSFQRTGTTSVGQFFKDHGYKVASYDDIVSTKWSYERFIGNYEKIFKSKEFKKNQVFEDNPWWEGDFYKFLFNRFPNSKFILFTRNPDSWFNSMLKHSNGLSLGNTFIHSKIYRRENELYSKFPDINHFHTLKYIDNKLKIEEKHRQHYINLYNLKNKEIIDFFNFMNPKSLFVCPLEDQAKWLKLGSFFKINVDKNYNVHANKSK